MSFTDLIYKTGDLIQATFGIFQSLKNIPNVIFITVFALLFIWWTWKLAKFDKEAKETGAMR